MKFISSETVKNPQRVARLKFIPELDLGNFNKKKSRKISKF